MMTTIILMTMHLRRRWFVLWWLIIRHGVQDTFCDGVGLLTVKSSVLSVDYGACVSDTEEQ